MTRPLLFFQYSCRACGGRIFCRATDIASSEEEAEAIFAEGQIADPARREALTARIADVLHDLWDRPAPSGLRH